MAMVSRGRRNFVSKPNRGEVWEVKISKIQGIHDHHHHHQKKKKKKKKKKTETETETETETIVFSP